MLASFLKLDASSILYLLFNNILFYSILPFTVRGWPWDRVILSQFITGLTQGDKQQSTLKLTPRDNLALQISLKCISLHCVRNTSKKCLGPYMNLWPSCCRMQEKQEKKTGDCKIPPMALRCPANRKAMHNRRDAIIPRPMLRMVCMFCMLMVCGIRNLRLQLEQPSLTGGYTCGLSWLICA